VNEPQNPEQGTLPGFEPVPEGRETVADVFEQLAGLVAEDKHVKITVYKVAENGKPHYCEEYADQVPSLSDLRKKWGGGKYQIGIYHQVPGQRGRSMTRRIDVMPEVEQQAAAPMAANSSTDMIAREAISALKESQKNFTEALERASGGRDMVGLSKMVNGILAESASNQLQLINAMTARQVPELMYQGEEEVTEEKPEGLKELILELVADFADSLINGGAIKKKVMKHAVESSEEYQYLLSNPDEYKKVFGEISQEQPQLVPKMRAMLQALGAPDPESMELQTEGQ